MGKATKIWLIIAAALVLCGGIIYGGVMAVFQWDFTKLSTVKYEKNTYAVKESYKNITIVTDTADVVLIPSETLESSVVCYEQENAKHAVSVKDGTLIIKVDDARKWYTQIGINFSSPKITVSVPQGEYGDLFVKSATGDVAIPKDFHFESIDISESTGDVTNFASASGTVKIKTGTGRIRVENISAGALDLSVTTGSVTATGVNCQGDMKIKVTTGKTNLTDIRCENGQTQGNTGDISLKNVIAAQKLSIKRTTGDVKFSGCDAAELFVKTDTGDVTGTLLSEKVFITKTDTGRVNVPKTVTGGRCEITTDTGDIKIQIQ